MEDPTAVSAPPQVAFKKRNNKTTSALRKRPATPPPADDSDSDYTSSEDEEGRQIKRRRKTVGVAASSKSHPQDRSEAPVSQPNVTGIPNPSNDATKSSNWYDEDNSTIKKTSAPTSITAEPDGTYKGVAAYSSFIKKNPNAALKQVGPQKSSSNVRTITTTDFAPDVCKDYKQTGFCGFGDSCKFLHARENYQQGWELDRDWEIGTRGKKNVAAKTVASANRSGKMGEKEDEDEEVLLESIPFKCIICKEGYKTPIVTKCGHYFCESCALQRYRKNPSCAACGAGTGGVFNVAKKLNRLLEKKRERAQLRKEKAMENGEEVSDDAEDGDPRDAI